MVTAAVIAMAAAAPATAANVGTGRALHAQVLTGTTSQPGTRTRNKIIFTYGPHTDAPPAMLGTFEMKKLGSDKRPIRGNVTFVHSPAGKIKFSRSVLHDRIGPAKKLWKTWSNGYKKSVYWPDYNYGHATRLVLTLPKGTKAFYLYVEPNEYKTYDLVVKAGSVSSGDTKVFGEAGAEYFGFYTKGKKTLSRITINCPDDFAIGEMAISR
jgi:hypothetical protein